MSMLLLGHHLSFEEVNPQLIFMPIVVQVLVLLSEKSNFLLSRGLMVSARWWPGLKRVSVPVIRGAGLTGAPEGRGASPPL
jgi:hypothetical protein